MERVRRICATLAVTLLVSRPDVSRAQPMRVDMSSLSPYAQGVAYERAVGAPHDLARAREAYRRGCARQDDRACAALGNALTLGPASRRDIPEALRLFTTACEAGAHLGCVYLVVARRNGHLAPMPGLREQVQVFEAACAAGVQLGCAHLGSALLTGLAYENEPAPDRATRAANGARAISLLTTACDLEEASACERLATAYSRGQGVAVDASRVTPLIERACALGAFDLCLEVVSRHERDPPNPTRDLMLFERACDGGVARACMTLAGLYRYGRIVAADEQRAFEFTVRACSLAPERCSVFGRDFMCENFERYDRERAGRLFTAACDGGHAESCGVTALHCVPDSER